MPEDTQRTRAFERIEHNIVRHGWHVYGVAGGPDPRFAYTIGLNPSCRREVILAGAAYYSNEDAVEIVNEVAKRLKSGSLPDRLELDGMGSFSFRNVDKSWSTQLLLGALDFYNLDEIGALQIVPDQGHWTLDIPNLSEPWNVSVEIRMVPLATMVAVDPSLEPVMHLSVESAIWRQPNEEWHPWRTAGG